MKACTIMSHVSLLRQHLALYMLLSEQNEDQTITLIFLSIFIWLSQITPRLFTAFDAKMNSSPTLRGWMIGGGLCIEYRIDIPVLLSFLHIILAISHWLISLKGDSILSFTAPASTGSKIRYNWLSSAQKWYFVPLWWAVMIFPRCNE